MIKERLQPGSYNEFNYHSFILVPVIRQMVEQNCISRESYGKQINKAQHNVEERPIGIAKECSENNIN